MDFTSRFKFRVWHKGFKRFLTGDEWYLGMDGRLRFLDYSKDKGNFNVFSPIEYSDLFVIEQCTGAKDKNDRLIYEGDIVRVKRCFTRPFVSDKIEVDYKFHEGEEEIGYLIWSWCFHKWLVSYEYKRYDDTDDFSGINHRHEVIGNVHEDGKIVKYED